MIDQLPKDMTEFSVLDIGAKDGAFARACLERNASLVVSVEPCPHRFDRLQYNLAEFGERSICLRYRIGPKLPFDVLFRWVDSLVGRTPWPAFGTGRIIDRFIYRIEIVKIDCGWQGEEIVRTSKRISEARNVVVVAPAAASPSVIASL